MIKHCDAEHPTVIPMDLPSSHQEPRGPMTRARARALENEVTSFISDITYDPLETWLLPKSDMLCMIRCQEDPHEDAREDGQATKSTDEENQRKRASSPSRPRTSGQVPGHPAPGAITAAAAQTPKPTGPRHPASSPDIRRHATEHPEVLPSSPDIRPLLKPRTSGPSPGHPAPPVCAQ